MKLNIKWQSARDFCAGRARLKLMVVLLGPMGHWERYALLRTYVFDRDTSSTSMERAILSLTRGIEKEHDAQQDSITTAV